MAAALTAAAVLTLASQYGDWDPQWVLWQVTDAGTGHGESSGIPDAYNPAGPFRGLMQVWDANAIRFGYQPEEMYDPAKNLAAAHRLWLERGTQPWPSAVKYPGRATVGVSADGWLDWAVRVPGPSIKLFAGTNPVSGIFFHSAEGYENGIYSVLNDVSEPMANRTSWHLSNLKDGRLLQHYPLTARCWHATAANQSYIGMEHEGVAGQALTDAQVANDKRVIADVSTWKGWHPRRPLTASDLDATLYEHGEVVRFGGSGSACPSHRIPWDKILATEDYGPMKLNADGSMRIEATDTGISVYIKNAEVLRIGGDTPGEISKNFNGTWYTLGHLSQDDDPGPGQQAPAVWSNTLND